MRRTVMAGLTVFFFAMASGAATATAFPNGNQETPAFVVGPDAEFVPDEILVAFSPTAFAEQADAVRRQLGAALTGAFPEIGVQHWKLPASISVPQALQALAANPSVRYAEPNYIVYAMAIPNDPLRNELWGLHNLGQTGGTTDADIDALEAWEVRTDAPAGVVGVIDTGIDYNHEDIVGNIWTNPGEDLNGNGIVDATDFNGLDDDGNGKVDDLRGWDCRNEDNDPMDDHNHGTHVAGTIGARGNNAVGVVGVNWNVKLMPLKFLSAGGSGTTTDAIECINYAASFVDASGNKVVRITSNSWGGGRKSQALQDAIAASGALFVAAAGNSGSSTKMYPAAYPLDNIISVAATDHNDVKAGFSNFGSDWVDLGAPGVSILSSTLNNGYRFFSGTSMATPHVSGACALVMAQFPAKSNAEVKATILGSVDPNPSLAGITVTGGRLNVARAVGGAPDPSDPTPPAAVADLAADPTSITTSSLTLTWTATGDDGAAGTAYLYDMRFATSPITDATWDAATKAPGEPIPAPSGSLQALTVTRLESATTYYFALRVFDEAGNPSSLSNVASGTTATPPPGSWITSWVDTQGNVGAGTSIDLDSLGGVHIAYRDGTNADLKYARRTGGGWVIETVPNPEGNVGCYPSLALDASDRARIAYGGGCGVFSWLKYAQWTGSAWLTEIVDQTAQGVGWDVSLALGPTDLPHIAHYKQWGQNALRYARWTGSQWVKESVEQGDGVGRGTSTAVDASGRAHISYTDPNQIRYAHFTGAAWQIEVVGTGYGQTAIALDATGTAYVAFTAPGGYLMLAHRTTVWWVVDAPASLGHGSLEIDGFGNPRIAYYDTLNRDLKYARWDGSAWVIQVVDSDGDVGAYPSLALDGAGNPHISYYDATSGDLKYARIQS